jgi:ribose transport system ATP-binding protein/rhamnose transport system ATP-binding protein
MREGRIAGEVSGEQMTEHDIMALATGGAQFAQTGGAHAFAH